MFLLLLMGLGAAGVKAQVRIGGNGAPNPAAVLDLNATDVTTGTKGLALPRVNLTSATMPLTTGVTNLTGMLVYNTTATIGAMGIYYWNGDQWVLASMPPANLSDTGEYLVYNGSTWVLRSTLPWQLIDTATAHPRLSVPVTWSKILDTSLVVQVQGDLITYLPAPGLHTTDLCMRANDILLSIHAGNGRVYVNWLQIDNPPRQHTAPLVHLVCYRPSA